ncbi:MAG: MoaD/ThiS family protein [Deltaproteobacteria bacterium]|nr:MoaD/ThiS family protein [Deltaproteobacteria bacterium]MBT5833266.1 MoaD/ThiS family protein [Deltaproteobacteria bacterium]MBT7811563.1 MoaD/ThiS family protein [Deltaproteobacteria bacterium]
MKINIELMGSLEDYLPGSERGQSVLNLKDESTIADLLSHLKIKRRVIVAVNGDEEKGLKYVLSEGDEVLVFTVISGG